MEACIENHSRHSPARAIGPDEKGAQPSRILRGIEQRVNALFHLIAAIECFAFAPAPAACDPANTFHHVVGRVSNQLCVDSKDMLDCALDLLRRVVTLTKASNRCGHQFVKNGDVELLGEAEIQEAVVKDYRPTVNRRDQPSTGCVGLRSGTAVNGLICSMDTSGELVERAEDFARQAHRSIGHVRKYSGKPYEVHLEQVVAILQEHQHGGEILAAGWLHDVLEDVAPVNPNFGRTAIRREFPRSVYKLVVELTDVYTRRNYPHLNRRQRHAREISRFRRVSSAARTVKLADSLANVRDIAVEDPEFARVYLKEKLLLLPALKGGDEHLYQRVLEEMTRIGVSLANGADRASS